MSDLIRNCVSEIIDRVTDAKDRLAAAEIDYYSTKSLLYRAQMDEARDAYANARDKAIAELVAMIKHRGVL